jgi:hypothetical protein
MGINAVNGVIEDITTISWLEKVPILAMQFTVDIKCLQNADHVPVLLIGNLITNTFRLQLAEKPKVLLSL